MHSDILDPQNIGPDLGQLLFHFVSWRDCRSRQFGANLFRLGQSATVDADYVNEHLGHLVQDEDLTRYIL